MLRANLAQGRREPIVTLSGQLAELRSAPMLLTTPGRWTADLAGGGGDQLTVDVRLVNSAEPVDDIGELVLRARLIAPDRIEIEISEEGGRQLGQRLSTWLADLRPGEHAHFEWFHPIQGEDEERSPWIAWLFRADDVAGTANEQP